jgi:hypothetical protein
MQFGDIHKYVEVNSVLNQTHIGIVSKELGIEGFEM